MFCPWNGTEVLWKRYFHSSSSQQEANWILWIMPLPGRHISQRWTHTDTKSVKQWKDTWMSLYTSGLDNLQRRSEIIYRILIWNTSFPPRLCTFNYGIEIVSECEASLRNLSGVISFSVIVIPNEGIYSGMHHFFPPSEFKWHHCLIGYLIRLWTCLPHYLDGISKKFFQSVGQKFHLGARDLWKDIEILVIIMNYIVDLKDYQRFCWIIIT